MNGRVIRLLLARTLVSCRLRAAEPPTKPCPSPRYEIAFYHELDFPQFPAGLVRRTLSKCMSGS